MFVDASCPSMIPRKAQAARTKSSFQKKKKKKKKKEEETKTRSVRVLTEHVDRVEDIFQKVTEVDGESRWVLRHDEACFFDSAFLFPQNAGNH